MVESIKQLAMRAKKRLKMQDVNHEESYSEMAKKKREKKNSFLAEYHLKKVVVNESALREKIDAVLKTTPMPSNPLGKLIDWDFFSTLSEIEKNRFVMNLSRIYREESEKLSSKIG